MLKAGEVFEIAMLAHDTPPSMRTRPVAAAASYHVPATLQPQRCAAAPLSGRHHPLSQLIDAGFPSRAQEKFPCNIKLIWPVQSSPRKYSGFHLPQITSISAAILSHLRGVSRSSRTLERDAVDAAVPAHGFDFRAGR
jgi:hypothetical protein